MNFLPFAFGLIQGGGGGGGKLHKKKIKKI